MALSLREEFIGTKQEVQRFYRLIRNLRLIPVVVVSINSTFRSRCESSPWRGHSIEFLFSYGITSDFT
ncbi:hypothetical protein R1sor_026081 [Riccia sorocarpa]|uniref:Uncharacterized protein n=1 Tax=Riccia sorocarpa TaxID=122646 RepID=A0ABD3GB01_9MARC